MTTDICNAYSNHASAAKGDAPALRRLAHTASAAVQWLNHAFNVYRQRRALLSLSDRQMHDIGLERGQAKREALRAFWDLPTNQQR